MLEITSRQQTALPHLLRATTTAEVIGGTIPALPKPVVSCASPGRPRCPLKFNFSRSFLCALHSSEMFGAELIDARRSAWSLPPG